MSEVKNYRIYFNSHGDFPLIASVDTGDDTEEINVKTISIVCATGNRLTSCYRPERQPKFWIQIEGCLKITDGNAVITQQELYE